MKDAWDNYPLSIISATFSSTIGGILVLFLSLDAASAVAVWVLEDEIPEMPMLLLMGFGPICLACMQLWGFAYALVLVLVLHRLIFQESSRLWTFIAVTPLHFVFSLIAFMIFSGRPSYDTGLMFRAIFALVVLVVPLAVTLAGCHLLRRKEYGSQHEHAGDGGARAPHEE